MTPEQMQNILDNAPPNAEEWRNNGFYYRGNGSYYWCIVSKQWFESLFWNNFTSHKITDLHTEIAKREPMDLRDVDIPHGTIVLEK